MYWKFSSGEQLKEYSHEDVKKETKQKLDP